MIDRLIDAMFDALDAFASALTKARKRRHGR